MKNPTEIPWSYSQLSRYEGCHLSWKLAYLEDHPRAPVGPYQQRGIDIHLELEAWLKKKSQRVKVPATLAKLEKILINAKAHGALGEHVVYLDESWYPTEKGGHWGVVKVDVHWVENAVLEVRDLKTGRVRDYADQGRIYLAGLETTYPSDVKQFRAAEIYTTGEVMPRRLQSFTRPQVLGIQKEVTQRVKKMHRDKTWKAMPGAACRFCDFAASRGGPCRHG